MTGWRRRWPIALVVLWGLARGAFSGRRRRSPDSWYSVETGSTTRWRAGARPSSSSTTVSRTAGSGTICSGTSPRPSGSSATIVEAALTNWVQDPYLISSDDPEVRRRLRALMEPHAEKRFLAHDPDLAEDPDAPALPRLGDLDVPALVLVGEDDIPDVHAHAGAIDVGLPDARRVVVPGAGHLVPFERPRAFFCLVLDFLR